MNDRTKDQVEQEEVDAEDSLLISYREKAGVLDTLVLFDECIKHHFMVNPTPEQELYLDALLREVKHRKVNKLL